MPSIFSKLLAPVGASYAVQVAGAAVFVPQQTEKYYDFTGAVGHLFSAAVSLYGPSAYKHFTQGGELLAYRLPPLHTFAPRQLAITLALSAWASRLGIFLFNRISKTGKDSRFDKIKANPTRFTFAWVMQGTWVALIGLPAWLVNAVPVAKTRPWGPWDTAFITLAALSLSAEILADRQKETWRERKNEGKHQEKFISSGLWAWSRHPNYVAEIGFHASLFALSCRSLIAPGLPLAAVGLSAASPLFTYFLLRYVSGVPLLEKASNKKWADDPVWKNYCRTTPVFWPWAPIYK